MATIHSLTSSLLASKTYLIEVNLECLIIIDPGDPDISNLLNFLSYRNPKKIVVFLTHEHADHCAGLNSLFKFKQFELFSTQIIAERIADMRLNLSKYFGVIEAFEIKIPVSILSEYDLITINGFNIHYLETPGHSPGSACIFTDEAVFTGDTILNNSKSPLNLPESNKKKYLESVKILQKKLTNGVKIYPGHGEPFNWNTEFTYFLQ